MKFVPVCAAFAIIISPSLGAQRDGSAKPDWQAVHDQLDKVQTQLERLNAQIPPSEGRPCTIPQQARDFRITFTGIDSARTIMGFVNDTPMNYEERGIATKSISDTISAAIITWCAKHRSKK